MNPLTQIKNTQKITKAEIELGLTDKASWHDRFKHSAYVFAGGLPFELTEGDLLAVFAQYGEIADVHLVRDKKTGKSRGFAFLAYEDQRSTVLVVDNLSGAKVAGRTVRVEHVDNYKRKRAEMEGEPVPESDDEDEEARQGAAQQQTEEQQNGGGTVPGGGGAGAGDAWAGSGSVHSLLTAGAAQTKIKTFAEIQAEAARRKREQEAAAEAAPAAPGGAGRPGWGPPPPPRPRDGKEERKKEKKKLKKEKKEKKKKDKKEKKEKRKGGEASSDSSDEEGAVRGGGSAGDARRPQQAAPAQPPRVADEPRGRPARSPVRRGGRSRSPPPRHSDEQQPRPRSRSRDRHDDGDRRRRARSHSRDRRYRSRSRDRRGGRRGSRSRSPPPRR